MDRDRDREWIQRDFFGQPSSERSNDCNEACDLCQDPSCTGECIDSICECGNPKEPPSAPPSLLRPLHPGNIGSLSLPLAGEQSPGIPLQGMQESGPSTEELRNPPV